MGRLLLEIPPEKFNRIELGRIARQLMYRQAVNVSRKEFLHRLARMILGPVLHQDHRSLGSFQNRADERLIALRVQFVGLPLGKERARKVLDEAPDLVGFALAAGRDDRLVSTPRPGVTQRTPLSKTTFVPKQDPSLRLLRRLQDRGPAFFQPFALFIAYIFEMVRGEAGLLIRITHMLQELRQVL